MGFFSWKTLNTEKSIPSVYSSRDPLKVLMLDNDQNYWTEHYYEGYGVFGGKDFYELVAEMNGKCDRIDGINMYFNKDKDKKYIFPNLLEWDEDYQGTPPDWVDVKPKDCEFQGFWYNERKDNNE